MAEALIDYDGENRAVRAFLMIYGTPGLTAMKMADHMEACGFPHIPDWVHRSPDHLTKAGAQLWLRMLFDLEKPPADATLHAKRQNNEWDHLRDFGKVWELQREGKWHWYANPQCKYVELRIDMRDGGCIIKDRDGNRISPEQLSFQIGGAK